MSCWSLRRHQPLYGILYKEDSEDFPFKTVQDYADIYDAIKSINHRSLRIAGI